MKLEKAQELEAKYTEEHPDDDNISNTAGYGRRHDANRETVNAALAKIDAEYVRKKEAQMELTTALARVSPVGSMTYLFTSLSANGINDVKRYQDDLVKIREMVNDEITQMMTSREFGMEIGKSGRHYTDKVKQAVYGVMNAAQEMGFSQARLEDSMETGWIDFLLMFFFALVPATITYVRFIGYDPR